MPKETKENSLTVRDSAYSLTSPAQVKQMATLVRDYIINNGLSVKIQDKDYVMVEGWQFAGGLLGTTPRVSEVVDLSKNDEVKWRATAEIVEIKTGKVISQGFAVCSTKEARKRSFDEYAVLSMAQTRAIGKAYRNVIGWVVKMAGYEATPSEEMIAIPVGREPAPSKTYDKAIDVIMKAETVVALDDFEKSLKKGRGAKLYTAQQRDQLLRFINERKKAVKT